MTAVSIAINNYNYGAYVGEAIDSALAQDHRDLEVLVVDDGSTDDSWQVISQRLARHPHRLRAIRTENGGQGAAYNLGFAQTRGTWLLFLDADDLLDADAVSRCLAAARDEVSKLQFPLRLVDRAGRPLGGSVPYTHHSGDLSSLVRRFGHYAGPPASGNLYRRSAIAPYFPLPAARWMHSADTVPFVTSALHGQVLTLPHALGSYRIHNPVNRSEGVFGNMQRTRAHALSVEAGRQQAVAELIAERSGIELQRPLQPLPWTFRLRAASWRFDGAAHPYPQDSAGSILRAQWRSLRNWPGYRAHERLALMAAVAAILLSPRPLAARLHAQGMAIGGARRLMQRLAGRAAR